MREKSPIISLFVLSILVGLIWRMEVEYHGWAGLTWVAYFHLAIPTGFCLFLTWANFFVKLDLKKRILINSISLIYGLIIYYVLETSLYYNFASGPLGFLLVMEIPEWKLNLIRFSLLLIIPFIPLGAFLILKLFRLEPNRKFLIISIISIVISIPLSVLMLEISNHKGGHDLIHSIKSGILIPFWVYSVGLLIIGKRTKN
ncbi:hypothetical protein [Flammeovirga sp. SJP92]|uniref:hypothetical protein n=1 Tax=Flammeovirga sp. SJP92 TaxID=1775430 RepID=UPI0012F7E366|nr:hypothetical protein [Flammeovirga sp. SJP92]